jgi:hypothetical protein
MLASQSEVYLVEDRWSILNSSRAAERDPDQGQYYALIAALDAGWEVEPPIYLRPDWRLSANESMVFHFVLIRSARRMTTLLSVPDGTAVRRLVSDNGWTISPPKP